MIFDLLLLGTAFFLNIPFGYLRENCVKFSGKWFLWIHASIPFLIYLRISFETSKLFIPVTIFFAVLGQIVGSRYRRSQMTIQDVEQLQQIPDLQLPLPDDERVDESEVMVALLNMGGPRTNEEVPMFLKRIFLDPLILRFPLSFIFQRFFAWLLVTLRGKEAQERYKLIGGASPIAYSTVKQTAALREELRKRGRKVEVTFSFNYSSPFPADTIHKTKNARKKYLLPLSLYPHYSLATTGSNIHYLKKEARKVYPDLKFLEPPSYFTSETYIQAFVDRVQEQIKPGESLDDFYLLFSAHGLPLYFLVEGDPYPYQINQTVRKVVDQLQRSDRWAISYQSDVGPLQWLKPSTENMIQALARKQEKKLLIAPISFVTDHIETLCEIDIEYREFAQNLGIEDFRMSRAIECHPGFIHALADSIERFLISVETPNCSPEAVTISS